MITYLGLDESGLGPMLGPLVCASSVFQLDAFENDDHFATKIAGVVSWKEKKKGKLFVGDSKKVYTPSKGLKDLETSALSFYFLLHEPVTFKEMLEQSHPGLVARLEQLPWYQGDFPLPIERDRDYILMQRDLLAKALETAGIRFAGYDLRLFSEAEFNQAVDRLENKGLVNFESFASIVKARYGWTTGTLLCALDRQGGRESYKELLEPLFTEGEKILGREMTEARSLYEVRGERCHAFLSFEVEGDDKRFAIGLASIFAKYVREGCMKLFNQYWQEKAPGIRPTAGYATDARRFLTDLATRPEEFGITRERLVRKR